MSRLEGAERKIEEQAEAASQASLPLSRQLVALTDSHAVQTQAWQRHEAALNNTIYELENRVSSLTASERSAREKYETTVGQFASLQDRISVLIQQNDKLQSDLKEAQSSYNKMEEQKKLSFEKLEEENARLNNELSDSKREVTSLHEVLSVERAALEAEKRKCLAIQERIRGPRIQSSPPLESSPRSSPTLSYGRASVSESLSSLVWPSFGDDVGDSVSLSGRLYESLRPCNNTSFIETLQAQLKLKDGEVQQLQWELAKRDAERNVLNNEVSDLTTRLTSQEIDLSSLSLLRTQYDALLQMYGEKLEESEELRMDLQDVKDMYKAQINELLKKEPSPVTTTSS